MAGNVSTESASILDYRHLLVRGWVVSDEFIGRDEDEDLTSRLSQWRAQCDLWVRSLEARAESDGLKVDSEEVGGGANLAAVGYYSSSRVVFLSHPSGAPYDGDWRYDGFSKKSEWRGRRLLRDDWGATLVAARRRAGVPVALRVAALREVFRKPDSA